MNREQYHHGNLRDALIKAASDIIENQGEEKLTIRGVSQKVGVSRTAPYRHFKDKSTLMCAVAENGFQQLKMELKSALVSRGSAEIRFRTMFHRFVNFACENPVCYRLMFSRRNLTAPSNDSLRKAANSAFQLLVEVMNQCQNQNIFTSDDPVKLSNAVWASAHGLSLLLIEEQIGISNGGSWMHALLSDSGAGIGQEKNLVIEFTLTVLLQGLLEK